MVTKFKFKIDGKCIVTQLDNGQYSHQGSTAWDIASKETNKQLSYRVNVPVTCKAVDKTYHFTWWETNEPVEFADGTVDYLTMMFGHDNDINAYVGWSLKANTQLGNMGTGGNASGDHVHIEFGKGKYKGTWYQNSQGVYVLYNAIPFTSATYADDLDFQTPTYADVKARWNEVKAKLKYTSENTETVLTVPNVAKGEKWSLDDFFAKLDEKLSENTKYVLGGIGRVENGVHTYDCVGLFKSIIWDYPAHPENYDVIYPDVNVGGMKSRASNVVSFDKSKMQKGMLVFIGTEHIGMVYDETHIIECTPSFSGNVQLTTPDMRSDKPWTEMGYADFLKYEVKEEAPTEPSIDDKPTSDINTLLEELQSSINSLQAENDELRSKVDDLEKENNDLVNELEIANKKLDEVKAIVV